MRTLLLLALIAAGSPAPGAAGQELIERTLALVGGQPITLSDVRAATAFGLVAADRATPDVPLVTAVLVDRELMLREVQRYAPPPPSEAVVDARLDEVRQRYSDPAAFDRALELHGLTEVRLRAWLRDDLRTVAYLAQRFASASTPTDADIAAAYARSRAAFDTAGLSLEQATPQLRERLVVARRAELISDWLSDLRRRTDVVILPQ